MTLAQVRKGTRVLDASGAEAGTVAEIKLGDPDAVTGEGQAMGSGDALADAVIDTVTPDLPPSVSARLCRTGYLKISPPGILHRGFYVSLDDVDSADGDAVRLAEDAGRFAAV
jgi:hypothetical protein